ncbi:O-antigen translocase [Providencia rettgeri]|uniref:O-antigen translocase n=1 Tax=Providencia TaxID=586 RepID=UPI00226E9AB6|nr:MULTISPECIES: O-antigen translocase [Providencia]MCX9097007.1 O-antigen translocase [Providencia rettgeri]MCX9126486.1 O-antigen translocase [Providencia rettgeri]MCX9129858.1 O-antigen translocase [Providencia rettgeri]HEM6846613.1 O-antigen translocase [Providencia rettgeri]
MTLIKTSLLSLIATFFKMLSGLVINKAVSVYIGPAGLAVIGQFQNFSQVVLIAAQGAINSGVVKYTAEYGQDSPKVPSLFSTALRISLISSIIVGFLLIIFSSFFSKKILDNIEYNFIFILFGFTVILFVLNGLLLSIINGLKEIRNYIKINIIQSLYSLFFTSLLIYFFGLKGALIALATNQSIIFFVTLFMLRKHTVVIWKNFTSAFDKTISKKLFAFSAMALTSAIMVPTSQFIIRDYIATTQGLDQAGYWQGVWYISSTYLMIVTTALSTYYLPRLSEITTKKELKQEILQGYKILLPIVITCGLVIYLLRDLIIYLLFSDSFTPMKPLFTWQIIGDVFKIASWLLAYVMLAKAMTKTFIISEIIFSISFIFLSYYLIKMNGTIGATYAYTLNYIFYFMTFSLFIKKLINQYE